MTKSRLLLVLSFALLVGSALVASEARASRCDGVSAAPCANAMSEESDGAARWQALTPRHRQLLLAVERREAEFHAHFGYYVPAELDYLGWLSAVIGADTPDERALVLRRMRRFVEEDRSLAEAR